MGKILQDILRGMGSLVDLRGAGTESRVSTRIINVRLGTPEDDLRALKGDMDRLGKDMRKAMLSIDAKIEKEEQSFSLFP